MANSSIMDERALEQNSALASLFEYWNTVQQDLGKGNFTIADVLRGDSPELQNRVAAEIKLLYVGILNLLEAGLAKDPATFNILRSKILGMGNDTIRHLPKILQDFHSLKYRETKEIFLWKASE